MNLIDPAQVISLELAKRDRAYVVKLEEESRQKSHDIGALVQLLKEAHELLPTSTAFSIRLRVAISEHDETWKPKPYAVREPWPTNAQAGTARLKR